MERQREGDQTAARRRATASVPRERRTTSVPRTPPVSRDTPTSRGVSSPGNTSMPRGVMSPGNTSMPRGASSPGESATMRSATRLGSLSGPRNTLVPRATRQIPAMDGYDDPDEPLFPAPSSALTPYANERAEPPAPVILSPSGSRSLTARITPKREPTIKPWMRLVAGVIAIIACIVAVLGFQLIHPAAIGDKVSGASNATSGVPAPSGRGPITASIGIIVAIPPPAAQHNTQNTQYSPSPTGSGSHVTYGLTSIQPCHDSVMFVPNITQWTVPPGCYAMIYKPNPANYPVRASWGWCNWWVEESHPQDPNITGATSYPRGTFPVANAAVFIDGGEQGASPEGHWAESVAVSSDGYWILISEMNFAWRGAGWGLVDYRYIHVSPHVHFLYGV